MAVLASRFREAVADSTYASDIDLGSLVRNLSRRVYILLYGLFTTRQLFNFSARGSDAATSTPSHKIAAAYLIYGLIGLIMIRILAAACAYVSKMQPSGVAQNQD